MKKMIGLMILGVIGSLVTAQETSKDTTLADVVKALERIEAQLDKEGRVRWRGDMSDVAFGGGPLYPVRYFLNKEELQKYFDLGGNYESVPQVLFPFVNGGGGTWRWTFNNNLSIGLMYYGFGFATLGFLKHDTDPNGPNVTVDENGDGWDDYFSFAEYGITVFSFPISYRVPFEGVPLGVFAGAQLGLGVESAGFTRSPRNVLAATLGIQLDALSWRRMVVASGVWAGLEIGKGVVKLALEGGLDYYIPLGEWTPASGMHRLDAKPTKDINPVNAWFTIGPHFNY